MKSIPLVLVPFAVCGLLLALPVCSRAAEEPVHVAAAPYVPGLGAIMGGLQSHHAKLWFAGEARNWPLAAYELREIGETLDDVQKLHPKFEDNSMATPLAIAMFVSAPMKSLEKSLAAKDEGAFQKSHDLLTAACNTCHQNYRHEFIQIVRPTRPPVTNQSFEQK